MVFQISMLQDQSEQLRQAAADDFIVDDEAQRSMLTMGFNEEIIKMALQFASNDMSKAVEMLLKMQTEGTYDNLLTQILDGAGSAGGASTSAAASSARSHIETKLKAMEVQTLHSFYPNMFKLKVCSPGILSIF